MIGGAIKCIGKVLINRAVQQRDIARTAQEGVALGGSHDNQPVKTAGDGAGVVDKNVIVDRSRCAAVRPKGEHVNSVTVGTTVDQEAVFRALPRQADDIDRINPGTAQHSAGPAQSGHILHQKVVAPCAQLQRGRRGAHRAIAK